MRFEPIRCPACGEYAIGTVDMVPCCAEFDIDEATGEVEWSGHTEVYWDGQQTSLGGCGRMLLQCRAGHEWEAADYEDETEWRTALEREARFQAELVASGIPLIELNELKISLIAALVEQNIRDRIQKEMEHSDG